MYLKLLRKKLLIKFQNLFKRPATSQRDKGKSLQAVKNEDLATLRKKNVSMDSYNIVQSFYILIDFKAAAHI